MEDLTLNLKVSFESMDALRGLIEISNDILRLGCLETCHPVIHYDFQEALDEFVNTLSVEEKINE